MKSSSSCTSTPSGYTVCYLCVWLLPASPLGCAFSLLENLSCWITSFLSIQLLPLLFSTSISTEIITQCGSSHFAQVFYYTVVIPVSEQHALYLSDHSGLPMRSCMSTNSSSSSAVPKSLRKQWMSVMSLRSSSLSWPLHCSSSALQVTRQQGVESCYLLASQWWTRVMFHKNGQPKEETGQKRWNCSKEVMMLEMTLVRKPESQVLLLANSKVKTGWDLSLPGRRNRGEKVQEAGKMR